MGGLVSKKTMETIIGHPAVILFEIGDWGTVLNMGLLV